MSIQHSPFTRVKKTLKSDINVVPYIDVMLVLLVIFMVTAPMMTAGLTVDLPDTPSDSLSVSQQLPAIVTIKPNGEYYLRIGDAADRLLTLDDIEHELTNIQSTSKQPLTVLLNGDEHVPYGNIVTLMSRLQKTGLRQVGLLTEPPQ